MKIAHTLFVLMLSAGIVAQEQEVSKDQQGKKLNQKYEELSFEAKCAQKKIKLTLKVDHQLDDEERIRLVDEHDIYKFLADLLNPVSCLDFERLQSQTSRPLEIVPVEELQKVQKLCTQKNMIIAEDDQKIEQTLVAFVKNKAEDYCVADQNSSDCQCAQKQLKDLQIFLQKIEELIQEKQTDKVA